MRQFPPLLQQNKRYHLLPQEPNALQKFATPTTFSLNRLIDIEGDPLLLLNNHRHRVSRLDDSLLTDIYLRVNLLIL
jgi:hypothetical protein